MGKVKEYIGWAIEARHMERGHVPFFFLLGRHAIPVPVPAQEVQDYLAGHTIALFKTRQLARNNLPKNWNTTFSRHRYIPVRVKVTVEKV